MTKIIAELCHNHNGDQELAKRMIHSAAECGAHYAKMQSIFASDLTRRGRFEKGVIEDGKVKSIVRPYQQEYDRLKALEFDWNRHRWFIEECRAAGIKPMTTIFTRAQIPVIAAMDWDHVKIASYDCASAPLLRELNGKFDHIYISTGAVTDEEIETASRAMIGQSYSFLHCVSVYPTPLDDVHLERLNYLRQFTPNVGFSDHSLVERDGVKASLAAIYFGASVIERHFTLLGPGKTKDGPVSIGPDHLKQLVEFSCWDRDSQSEWVKEQIPEYKLMLGSSTRKLTETELLNRDYYRGRFASHLNGEVIYNWDERALP